MKWHGKANIVPVLPFCGQLTMTAIWFCLDSTLSILLIHVHVTLLSVSTGRAILCSGATGMEYAGGASAQLPPT